MHETINFDNQPEMVTISADLTCYELSARNSGLQELPPVDVLYRIDLSGCRELVKLPDNLHVGSLNLQNCIQLKALPLGISVSFLDVSGCVNLTDWPLFGRVSIGRFVARDCVQLTQLPPWINNLGQLDVHGCTNLTQLPADLCVSGWIDIGDTQISSLPVGCQAAELRWNGVRVTPRIAFRPDTITGKEVLQQENAELRRVLLERMGVERFVDEVNPELLHADTDPGGPRQLLRVPMGGDEPLVALAVQCPSTARRYLLRVPPTMRNCHHAAAWIAGFDNPADYAPLIET